MIISRQLQSLTSSHEPLVSEGNKFGNGDTVGSWSSVIGIVTAIIGNILISFALNLQRYAHIRIARDQELAAQAGQEEQGIYKDNTGRSRRTPSYAAQSRIAEDRVHANLEGTIGRGKQIGSDGHTPRQSPQNSRRGSTSRLRSSGGETDPLIPRVNRQNTNNEAPPETDGDDDAGYIEADDAYAQTEQQSYLQSPYWWLGITLMLLGEAGNFLAYGFAPASIVSPLGVVALISNGLIAPVMLKEPFRLRDFFGIVVATAGAVTVVLSATDSNPKIGPEEIWRLITTWEFETYLVITIVLIVVLLACSAKYGQKSILIDLGLVALLGGYTALSTKGVASLLSYRFWRVVTFPITYLLLAVLIGTAIMQIRYINRALQRFDATEVIPTQFVLFTISVIVGSAILYRDFKRTSSSDAAKFFGGCLMTFAGVWLITSMRMRGTDDENKAEGGNSRTDRRSFIRLVDEEEGSYPHTPKDLNATKSFSPPQTPTAANRDARSASATSNTPSSLIANPWAEVQSPASSPQETHTFQDPNATGHVDSSSTTATTPIPKLYTTMSSPALPSDSQILPNQLPTPYHHPSSSRTNAELPATPIRSASTIGSGAPSTPISSTRFRGGIQGSPLTPHSFISGRLVIVPNPLTGTLSGPLSAVVADSLRRGFNSPGAVAVAGPPTVRRRSTMGATVGRGLHWEDRAPSDDEADDGGDGRSS